MKTNPIVSVCVPVFNGEKFLLEALESIRNQSYQNLELIISDDCSSDSSMKLIADFLKTFEKPFKVVSNLQRGIGSNWNNCVRNANGKYIKFLFQDDILYQECLTEMINVAKTDPKVGMVYSDRAILFDSTIPAHVDWVNANGDLNKCWNIPLESGIFSGSRILKDKNLFLKKPFNKIGEPTAILFKKEVFEKVGYFDTELIQFLDLEFSLRVLSIFKFGYIKKELSVFRLHENQSSNYYSKSKIDEKKVFFVKVLRKIRFKLGVFSIRILAETLIDLKFKKHLKKYLK